jgi:membrane-associated phospholipid phosphatase
MTTGPRFRWWFLLLVAAGLLLMLSFLVDAGVHDWMTQNQQPSLRNFMRAVSRFGDWPEHIAIGLALLGLAWWRHSKKWMRIAVAMMLACAIAGATARVIKISTGRARPSVQAEASWSGPSISSRYNAFPSGHTAASTAFFASLAFACWRIGTPLLLIPLLIAFSRMYVAAHYLSDVVCAVLIGVLTACLVTTRILRPFRNPQSEIRN